MESLNIVLACALVGSSLALNSWELPQGDQLWESLDRSRDGEWMFFKAAYNKTYPDLSEEVIRRVYWEDNMKFIREHNEKYDRGESTFYLGDNEFADMSEDEFKRTYLSGLIVPDLSEEVYPEPLTEPDPETPLSMDWRQRGIVTSVKSQGSCGSCWAFSALGAMESLVMKKKRTRRQEDFSEQNLVDCAYTNFGNHGCRGGWMNNAYKYIQRSGGIDRESCYRYRGRKQNCMFKRNCVAARVRGYRNSGRSEHSVARDIHRVGPVAIAADVSGRTFGYYRGGVWRNPSCNPSRPNHAMVAVGYGASRAGKYWVIKNSWGSRWGSQGYIYMSKNNGNDCGIKNFASYPHV